MDDTASSVRLVPIRLTDERWRHITEAHGELAGMRREVLEAVSAPTMVLAGRFGELLAVRETAPGRYLVVVYREADEDGFIITAFLTSKPHFIGRRAKIWPIS
jgi:hypothetical protein